MALCLATPAQEKAVVDFVKKWRNKRFCTCNYIRSTMKLKVTNRTTSNTLNRHGYFWRPLRPGSERGRAGKEEGMGRHVPG